jgi:phosphoribosylglycinamide formyltransferase 1
VTRASVLVVASAANLGATSTPVPGAPLTTTEQHRLRLPAPARVVVLASGSGSLLQALLDACEGEGYPARVVTVVSDRAAVGALDRATAAGIDTAVVPPADHPDRAAWDAALADTVAAAEPDLVVSAGFARLLGTAFLARFGGRTINTHPALLPAFPGAHPVRDTITYGVKVTGATVHLVDAGVDTGPVLAQEAVTVERDDTEDTLHERIKVVERRVLVETVAALVRHGATVTGRGVRIP